METPLRRHSSYIISNLPEEVKETILVHLPIRDAIKTSLLSNKWRYKWTNIPTLVFDKDEIRSSISPKKFRIYKLVNFVDRVLLNHNGSIHKFELSSYSLQAHVIDSWILFLSRNEVKEIVLEIRYKYEVHSSIFSCEAICCLNLSRCILKPPPMFKGFSYLRSLELESVTLADEALESMISSCTVLEILRLVAPVDCSCIRIRGSNLKHFYFEGEFYDICFIDAPHLSFVSIDLYDDLIHDYVRQAEVSNLVRVLGCLTGLEKLEIGNSFLEFLVTGNLPKRLPVTYDCLKSISLYIIFEELKHILAMLCLFQSSPNLQELELVANEDTAEEYVEDFWKAQGHWNCSMNQLRVVNISMFGVRPELEFIEFLLAHSPVLEILSVDHCAKDKVEESRVLEDLVKFHRASTKAEIEYRGQC